MAGFYNQMVLLSGPRGSGKTTAQTLLIDTWGKLSSHHKALAINFADPLYEMAEAVRDIAAKYKVPKKMPKDGPLLQLLGTDWGRNTVDQDIWVRCLKGKIEFMAVKEGIYAYDNSLFVVGDCRFRNEFDAFPGALRVRLNCGEHVRKDRCSMWRENTAHASETDLDEYDRAGKFDLYFDTSAVGPGEIIVKVIETLKSNSWQAGRAHE